MTGKVSVMSNKLRSFLIVVMSIVVVIAALPFNALQVYADETYTSLKVSSNNTEMGKVWIGNDENLATAEYQEGQELQITAMGTSALEVFEKASSIIKTLDTQRRTIEKQLQELEDSQNSTPSRVNLSNSLMFWQPYRYVGNTKILLIRELSACRYLTSFTLGYLHHLHYEMNKRVKLVICRQKAQGLALRYNHEMFTFINSDNANMSSLYDSEIIVTDSPKKEIMKDLLSKPCDLIIVLDRLFGNMDIVSGKITAKVNAISGRGDLQRFHVKAEDCIFSVTGVKNSFCNLFTIKDFPDEVDARYAYYNQTFAESYKKFDKKVGIIK